MTDGEARSALQGSTTSGRRSPPIIVALAVLATVPLFILRFKLKGPDDPDSFWHVLSGQQIWATWQLVSPDPLSSFTTNEWIRIDWLSDLVMAGTFSAGGLAGIAWLYTALDIMLFAAIYVACRVRAGVLLSGIAAFVGWFGTYASLAQRPQTVSFILLAVTLAAWSHSLRGSMRPPWWLVPLTWVWACSHGLWFLGPLVGLILVSGLLLDRQHERSRLLRLMVVPLLSVAAACLTPLGPRLLLMPFTVNSYGHLVSEWQPPDVHQPNVAATMVLVALVPFGWARLREQVSWAEILLWASAVGWAVLYTRTVAVAAVIAAPMVANQLSRLLAEPRTRPDRLERLVIGGSVALAMGVGLAFAGPVASEARGMPTDLAVELRDLPADTIVLNDDVVGGWLLLEHPHLRPVIDTRTYLFSTGYVEDYIRTRQRLDEWEAILARSGATVALLAISDPLADELTGHLGWVEQARGSQYVLLARDGGSVG